MNSILLDFGEDMSEEVSEARFATLENEVKHITADIAEIKENTKTTQDAIRSIDISIAIMVESIKTNSKLAERVQAIETKVENNNAKIAENNTRIAVYTGGVSAIGFVMLNYDKIKDFFG